MLLKRILVFPLLLGFFGIAVLVSLGVWQSHRLVWKESVLSEIDSRIAEPPIPIPRSVRREFDNFLSVAAQGSVVAGELFVLTSRQGIGPGFRVIAPFEMNGRRILVDRGFIPEARRSSNRDIGRQQIVGNLHWPDEVDSWFTPEPDGELWFARDVPAMALQLDAEPLMLVVRESDPATSGIYPWPVDSSSIPNNHLNYAITWFLLAIAWCGMTGLWIWRICLNPGNLRARQVV